MKNLILTKNGIFNNSLINRIKDAKKSIIKASLFFFLISFITIAEAKSTNITITNNTAYTFTVQLYDAFGNIIYTVSHAPGTTTVLCITGTPATMDFIKFPCVYTLAVNSSGSCSCSCPPFSGVTFSNTFTINTSTCSGFNSDDLTITF